MAVDVEGIGVTRIGAGRGRGPNSKSMALPAGTAVSYDSKSRMA